MSTGPPSRRRGCCAARSARCAMRRAVEALRPRARPRRAVRSSISLGRQLVEPRAVDVARARARSSRRRATRHQLDPRARHPALRARAAAGRLRARHRCLSDGDGQLSFGPRSKSAAVPAVEQVGVAAVARVHLDERPPGRPRSSADVQLRAPALGALAASSRARRGRRRCSAAATAAGAGRRFGAPNTTSSAGAHRRAERRGEEQFAGTPALPATAITSASRAPPRDVGGAAPRPAEPRLSHHGRGSRAGDVRSDGNERRRPATYRSSTASGSRPASSIAAVEPTEDRRSGHTGRARASPSRRQRCRTTSRPRRRRPARTTATTCASASNNSRTDRALAPATRPRSSVTPSVVWWPMPITTTRSTAARPHTTRRTTSPGWR